MRTTGEAEEIADELLHRTGRGLVTGDFEIFRPCFDLPQTMETLEGARVLRHEGDLRQVFESMRGCFKENGVVDLVRSIVSSEFLNADTVGPTHTRQPQAQRGAGGVAVRAGYMTSRSRRATGRASDH